MSDKGNSSEYLRIKIDELREILNDLIISSENDKYENEIIKLSQLMDDFIEKYMKE